MAWFSKSKSKKENKSSDIWIKCPKCENHIFKEDWFNNFNVCPKCNFHSKIPAYERIGLILDSGTFEEINISISPADPLGFVDAKESYKEKVAKTRKKTGLNEAIITGTGEINGIKVVVAVMDFRFMGGSLGSGTGEKILQASNHSYEKKIPFIIFSASGGARMHEGILSLMQMAKTCAGIARLDERKIPFISVLTDPTTGGVSASYATVGDVNIAEPGALIGFAGRRVIETTIKQKLPDDFQTSEYLLEHGFIDFIANRPKMKNKLYEVLSFYNR
ncbi:MAG: acetyl-CoA carboxylase carboxyltransferase subunit beta [Candidatus Delongbacteria bacterium]|nr:acetyl-CoA carboxylase carboxyltransferase subunit beta [Candidatus Delongbacteria bacterium]